jgi:hypothetical protein
MAGALQRGMIQLCSLPAEMLCYARIFASEFRSLYIRIAYRLDTKSAKIQSRDYGYLYQALPSGGLVRSPRTFSRIECIETLSSTFRWVTYADTQLALAAWELGRQFGSDNPDSKSTDTELS